eukprot:10844063-Karenia_brevis.AAC.1
MQATIRTLQQELQAARTSSWADLSEAQEPLSEPQPLVMEDKQVQTSGDGADSALRAEFAAAQASLTLREQGYECEVRKTSLKVEKLECIAELNSKQFTTERSLLETELAKAQHDQQNAVAQLDVMQRLLELRDEELAA